MSAVINFALSCSSPCKYQYQKNPKWLTLLLWLFILTVYLLPYLNISSQLKQNCLLSHTAHVNKYGPHTYSEGWKAVYHAKREHQRLRGEVAKIG